MRLQVAEVPLRHAEVEELKRHMLGEAESLHEAVLDMPSPKDHLLQSFRRVQYRASVCFEACAYCSEAVALITFSTITPTMRLSTLNIVRIR